MHGEHPLCDVAFGPDVSLELVQCFSQLKVLQVNDPLNLEIHTLIMLDIVDPLAVCHQKDSLG